MSVHSINICYAPATGLGARVQTVSEYIEKGPTLEWGVKEGGCRDGTSVETERMRRSHSCQELGKQHSRQREEHE